MPDQIEVHGAGKAGVDYLEVPTPGEAYLEALQVEREGYERRLAAGQTEHGGERIADILARNAAEIVRMGGRISHASFVGEHGPEIVVPLPENDVIAAAAGSPTTPPHEGWVRDRETGEWREPKPRGRRPQSEA